MKIQGVFSKIFRDSIHQLETEPHGHLTFGIPGVFDTPQFTQYSVWIFGNNKKVAVKGNYTSNSGVGLLYALSAGIGLAWGSELFIREELKRKQLVEVRLDQALYSVGKII